MSLPTSPSALISKNKNLAIALQTTDRSNSLYSYVSPKQSYFNYSEASIIQQQAMHRQLQQKAIMLKQNQRKLRLTLKEIQKGNMPKSQISNSCVINKAGVNKHKRAETFDFPTRLSQNKKNYRYLQSLQPISSDQSLENNDLNHQISIIYKCLGEGIEKQSKELTHLNTINEQQSQQIGHLSFKLSKAQQNLLKLQTENSIFHKQLQTSKQSYNELLLNLKQEQQKRLLLQLKLQQIQKILINPQMFSNR